MFPSVASEVSLLASTVSLALDTNGIGDFLTKVDGCLETSEGGGSSNEGDSKLIVDESSAIISFFCESFCGDGNLLPFLPIVFPVSKLILNSKPNDQTQSLQSRWSYQVKVYYLRCKLKSYGSNQREHFVQLSNSTP